MAFIKKTNFTLHPEGSLSACLIDLVEVPSLNPDWLPQFKCTFLTEVTDQGREHMPVIYYVTQKLSSLSKFGQMVTPSVLIVTKFLMIRG